MKHLVLSSIAFRNNEKIPSNYTCDGEDINPPFTFENVPEEAESLLFLAEDPDAKGKTWLHWAVINISPTATGINEDSVPVGGNEIVSDFGNIGYGGPCPSTGMHRYHFKLFALDRELDLSEDATLAEIYDAIDGAVLDTAEIVGLYSRDGSING